VKKYDAEIKALQTKLRELKLKKKKGASRNLKNTILPAARKTGLADLDLDPVALEAAFAELVARLSKGEPVPSGQAEHTETPAPSEQPAEPQGGDDEHKPFWKR
jgi:hypothetical protein